VKTRLAFLSAILLGAIVFSGSAQAGTLVFNLPTGVSYFGPSYSQDGYTFTSTTGYSNAYGNWVAIGGPSASFNAGSAPNIFQEYWYTATLITNNSGTPFSFTSIGLAGIYNNGTGGDVRFTFNYVSGPSTGVTVDLTSGIFALQTFTFDQNNLTSVFFTPTTTQGPSMQFNDVGLSGISSPVPEPSTWSMLLLAFAGVGFMVYRSKPKAGIDAA
jgi:hypothetical protein